MVYPSFPSLMLGTAKIDITPQCPVHLAGFSNRVGLSAGVSQHIYAKIWYFRCLSNKTDFKDALLIQFDLIWCGNKTTYNLISNLSSQYGIAPDAIIFHANHNHSGPQTCDEVSPLLGIYDCDYIDEISPKITKGVGQAQNNLEPVLIERGRGECHIGINRRKVNHGIVEMLPNGDGPIDPEVTVIRFVTNTNETKGILFHYTCHASTTDCNMISSEFGGAAAEIIEREIGKNAIASFLQGFCADIRPTLIRNGRFYRGNEQDVLRLGETLSREVMNVLSKPMTAVEPVNLISVQTIIMLPFEKVPTESDLKTTNYSDSIYKKKWKTLMLNNPERIRSSWPLMVILLQISDHLAFLGMNAEMAVDYGLFIKKYSHGDILPLGYCNGIIGYVPTSKQLQEGGYEAWDAPYYFGLPSRFSTKIEQYIYEGCKNVIEQARIQSSP